MSVEADREREVGVEVEVTLSGLTEKEAEALLHFNMLTAEVALLKVEAHALREKNKALEERVRSLEAHQKKQSLALHLLVQKATGA